MKDAFGWIAKVKDIPIKNALTILGQNIQKLAGDRIAALEAALGVGPGRLNPLVFYQTVKDDITPVAQRKALALSGFQIVDDAASDHTSVVAHYHTVMDEGADLPPQPFLDFQGAGVVAIDGLGKTVVTISGTPAAHAPTHESGGSDVVAAGEIRTTTGPTDLVVGAIVDGEFLKRVGATVVSAAAGGSTPTGTGFRHVIAGVEDAAAKLVDTADVNADQITYPKIQNVSAASRLLGRGSAAGAGDPEELTLGTNLSLAGTVLNAATGGSPPTGTGFRHVVAGVEDAASFAPTGDGDIMIANAGTIPLSWQPLPIGTPSQQLRVNGAGDQPEWFTPSAGGAAALKLATVTFPFPAKKYHSAVSVVDATLVGTELIGAWVWQNAPNTDNSEDLIDLEWLYGNAGAGVFYVTALFRNPFAGALRIIYLIG